MKKSKTTFAGTIVVLFLLLTFHFTNGQTWTSMAGFTAEDISIGKGGVVWATGKDLNVYRWNGANWENMQSPRVRFAP